MAHHGWVSVIDPATLTPSGLKAPFGRLFEAANHVYSSHAIALLSGAGGPLSENVPPATAKPGNPAGFTFLGQFIDHDLTEFRVIGADNEVVPSNPTIGQRQRVLEDGKPNCTNGRLGLFDLDSVYGLLGNAQPDLFDADGLFILNTAEDGTIDFARGPAFRNNRLIADPRNDENKLIAQVHMLFQRLHNRLHETKSGSTAELRPGGARFRDTKAAVIAAYQRIVFADYLPRIVQQAHIDAVLRGLAAGNTFYQRMNARALESFLDVVGATRAGQPIVNDIHTLVPGAAAAAPVAMPVEFAHAVFRLGHSQLLNGYRLNAAGGRPLFGPSGTDLRGNDALTAETTVDWPLFFDIGSETAQRGAPIDTGIARVVFQLPPPAIGEPPVSLAERNIRRGVDFGLPSGQQAASYLSELYGGIAGLDPDQLFPAARFGDLDKIEALRIDASLGYATPLWYYMLCEAEQFTDGPQLGTVGGLIVAETFLGSLSAGGFNLAAAANAAPALANSEARPAPAQVDDIWFMSDLIQFI
jgi:hypothetical protein